MLNLTKPRILLLDFDNTLVYTWDVMITSLQQTMTRFELEPWDIGYIKRQMHVPMKEYFPQLFGKHDTEARQYYAEVYKANDHLVVALPNAEKMLDYAQSQGLKMGIISNKRDHVLKEEINNKFKWNGYFSYLRGALEGQVSKPEKAVVDSVLSAMKTTHTGKDIWFIGDSYVDILTGKNSNSSSILFGDEGDITKEVLADHSPDWHVENHQKLILTLKSTLKHSI